jgi:hypothetical protein
MRSRSLRPAFTLPGRPVSEKSHLTTESPTNKVLVRVRQLTLWEEFTRYSKKVMSCCLRTLITPQESTCHFGNSLASSTMTLAERELLGCGI